MQDIAAKTSLVVNYRPLPVDCPFLGIIVETDTCSSSRCSPLISFLSVFPYNYFLASVKDMSSNSANVQYQEAHAGDTAVARLIAVLIVCFVISYAAIILRILSRRLSRTRLGTDDWLILLSLVIGFFVTILIDLTLTPCFTALHHSIFIRQHLSDAYWPGETCNFNEKTQELRLGKRICELRHGTLITV